MLLALVGPGGVSISYAATEGESDPSGSVPLAIILLSVLLGGIVGAIYYF